MIIWLISACINAVAAVVFFFFGSGDVQEWAKVNKDPDSPSKKDVNKVYDVEKQRIEDEENHSKRERRISEISSQDFS